MQKYMQKGKVCLIEKKKTVSYFEKQWYFEKLTPKSRLYDLFREKKKREALAESRKKIP